MFPDDKLAMRSLANRAGVSYDADNAKTLYAEDIDLLADHITAIENNVSIAGWIALSVIPTLQSSDDPTYVLRFAANMTAIFCPGMRLKLTQNSSVKFFIVTAVGSYTSGNTDVTVYGGTDYDVNNTSTYPITLPYFSREKAPVGFSLDESKWKIETIDTGITSQDNPTSGTWYNINSKNIVLPIGQWHVSIKAQFMTNAANPVYVFVTLSTANNSESDVDFTRQQEVNGSSLRICILVSVAKTLLLASKTTYYLNAKVGVSGISNLWLRGDNEKMIIRATCAYL